MRSGCNGPSCGELSRSNHSVGIAHRSGDACTLFAGRRVPSLEIGSVPGLTIFGVLAITLAGSGLHRPVLSLLLWRESPARTPIREDDPRSLVVSH